MAEPFSTFHAWVVANFPVDSSPMGEVAGDWRADSEFPTSAGSWEEVEDYLRSIDTDDSVVAMAQHAWGQYRAERAAVESAELADQLVSSV